MRSLFPKSQRTLSIMYPRSPPLHPLSPNPTHPPPPLPPPLSPCPPHHAADWVTKYGPAIRAGTSALRFASAIGRVVGLPVPNPSQYFEGVLSAEAAAISSCIAAVDGVLGTDGRHSHEPSSVWDADNGRKKRNSTAQDRCHGRLSLKYLKIYLSHISFPSSLQRALHSTQLLHFSDRYDER